MENRIENLEIKVAFLEKNLEELDEVVRCLSDELSNSHKEIKWLRNKVLEQSADNETSLEGSDSGWRGA